MAEAASGGSEPKTEVSAGLTFTQLLGSLQVRPLCEGNEDQELGPEQEAALHVFLHEILASYYRLTMVVPAAKVATVFDRRISSAAKDNLRRGRGR